MQGYGDNWKFGYLTAIPYVTLDPKAKDCGFK